MRGILHVLRHASPESARLASQVIEYDEPPLRGRRFTVRASTAPGPWKTDRVEIEPQRVTESSVWFRTAHTAYLLEQEELGGPEDDAA